MKELSIEEKARRYDEAIKTARKINSGEGVAAPPDWTICEVIFPELKESEDERIRKEMIETLKNEAHEFPSSIIAEKSKSWIAWLEKQCEKKPVVIIPKFRVGDEIKTSNKESLTITKIDEKGYWSGELFICDFDEECIWDLVRQKPDNWIQELEDKLANATPKQLAEWKEKYFKEEPAEWSEEDIDNIKNIIILCNHSIEGIECTWIPSQAAKIKKLMESILHSSKPHSTWKPNDEQMELLREVQQALLGKDCHNRFVNFMYELKRLREE